MRLAQSVLSGRFAGRVCRNSKPAPLSGSRSPSGTSTCPEVGAPISAVAKAVGHMTVCLTEVYGHISNRAAGSAAELTGNQHASTRLEVAEREASLMDMRRQPLAIYHLLGVNGERRQQCQISRS